MQRDGRKEERLLARAFFPGSARPDAHFARVVARILSINLVEL